MSHQGFIKWGEAQFRNPPLRSRVLTADCVRASEKTMMEGQILNGAEKSNGILEQLVLSHSDVGGWILDVCGGTGSLVDVAMRLGRNVMILEQDKEQANLYGLRVDRVVSQLKETLMKSVKLPDAAVIPPQTPPTANCGIPKGKNDWILAPGFKCRDGRLKYLTV